jgi:type IV secretion system protein VirD4
MSAIVIIQNLMQLKNKFPEHDLDKNLIGNMSIVDILGAPDVDSCEYLSKLFGTMTIHKQTTGLSTGSQGSFSRNEDVMQKPLFSQEDMFGMNKDGPCAIAIKGTDPLWVQKCKFEDSPLYPLLTRKKPYRAKQKITMDKQVTVRSRSPCEQIPDFMVGDEAEAYVKQCREEGITVIHLTETELDALAVLESHNIPIEGKDASTNTFWRRTFEQTKAALEEARKNALDLDSFDNGQLIVVQRLRNAGFSPAQINGLGSLIRTGFSYEDIITYFGTHMPVKEIEEFAGRLAKIKSNDGGNHYDEKIINKG